MSLGRKEGSRRAICVYIAFSGTGSLPCHAPCVLFGSGHLLSGTTLVASDVSQSTLGSLYQNTCFKELQSVTFVYFFYAEVEPYSSSVYLT